MKILLLCSAFNGLSQRVWIELRAAGHEVRVQLAGEAGGDVRRGRRPRTRSDHLPVPARAGAGRGLAAATARSSSTPGPAGDRGPSSLDWAIIDGEPAWGVTALQAVEEMDAGPIWATRTFPLDPAEPPRKSALYNGPVADAAIELVHEVVAKAADPAFVPEPLDYRRPDVRGRLRPTMRQADREFSWSDPTATILRRIRAADGSPGRAHHAVPERRSSVFDAHPGPAAPRPARATVLRRRHGAVLVRTGDGGVWIGHLPHGGAGGR